nr:MAG: hypothetical protein DIU67_08810 [Actinomycetota bacterium]
MVVAGGADDLEWLARHAADHGIRRVIALNVAGAFHSQFMAPAAARLEAALRASEVKPPQIPVWSNTTAEPHGSEIVETLVEQVVAPVRFAESLENMAATGISTFVHVGPGDVTAGMARKTIPGAQVLVVSSLDDIPGAVQSIGTM